MRRLRRPPDPTSAGTALLAAVAGAIGFVAVAGLVMGVMSFLVPPFRFDLEDGQAVQDARLDALEGGPGWNASIELCAGSAPADMDIVRWNDTAACWQAALLPPDIDVVNRLCPNATLANGDLLLYNLADDCYVPVPPAAGAVALCVGEAPAEGDALRYDALGGCYRSVSPADGLLCGPVAPGDLLAWNGSCAAGLDPALLDQQAAVDTLIGNVTGLAANVDTLVGNVTGLAADVSALQAAPALNASAVCGACDIPDIAPLEAALNETQAELDTLELLVAGLSNNASCGCPTVDLAPIYGNLSLLAGELDAVELDVGALQLDVAGLAANLSAAQAQLAGLALDVADVEAAVAGLAANLSALDAEVAGLAGDVAGLAANLTVALADLASLAGDVAAAEADITTLFGDVAWLGAGLANATTRLGALELEAAAYRNATDATLADHEARIAALEAAEPVQDARLDALEGAIDDAALLCNGSAPSNLDILRWSAAGSCWLPALLPPDIDVVNQLCPNQTLDMGDIVVYDLAGACYLAVQPAADPVNVCVGDVPLDGQILQYDGGTGCYRTIESIRITDDWLCSPPAPVGSLLFWNGSCLAAFPLADLALRADLDAVAADLNATQAQLALVAADVGGLQLDVAALQGNLSALDAEVGALALDVAALQGNVSLLAGELGLLQADVAVAQADIAALQGNLSAAQADIGTLFADVASAEAALANLTVRVDGLEADFLGFQNATNAVLADHEARISALEADAPVQDGRLDALEETIQAAALLCNGSVPANQDILRWNAAGACWLPAVLPADIDVVNMLCNNETLNAGDVLVYNAADMCYFAVPPAADPVEVCVGDVPLDGQVLRYDDGSACYRTVGPLDLLDAWLCSPPILPDELLLWNGTCFATVARGDLDQAADVAALQLDVADLQADVGALQGNLSATQAQLDALELDVAGVQANLSSARSAIAALELDVADLQLDVAGLQANLSAVAADVAVLQADLAAAEADILALQGDVAAAEADIATLFGETAALTGGLANLTLRVDGLEADFLFFQNATNAVLADHEARIAALEAAEPVQDARLDALEGAIDDAALLCNGSAPSNLDIIRWNAAGSCWLPAILPPDIDVVNMLCPNETLSAGDILVFDAVGACYNAVPPASDPVQVCVGDTPLDGQVLRYNAGLTCYSTVAPLDLLDAWLCNPPIAAGEMIVWNGTCFGTVARADLDQAADVAALQLDVADIQADVGALQGNLSATQAQLDALELNVAGLAANLSALDAEVAGVVADVSSLQTDVAVLQGDVASAQADIFALQSSVATAETDIATLFGETASLIAGLANLTARVDALESDFLFFQNATSAVLADHETRIAALEAATFDSITACNGTAFVDNDLARYDAGGACWEPYRINLRDGHVRVNGFGSPGSPTLPVANIVSSNSAVFFTYGSPLVYSAPPITRWANGVPVADSSFYNSANDTVIENVIGQSYTWRLQFEVDRGGFFTSEVRIGMFNPVSGFVVSTTMSMVGSSPIYTVDFTTIADSASVPPAFGGTGIGYRLFTSASSTAVDSVTILSLTRFSNVFLAP